MFEITYITLLYAFEILFFFLSYFLILHAEALLLL